VVLIYPHVHYIFCTRSFLSVHNQHIPNHLIQISWIMRRYLWKCSFCHFLTQTLHVFS
jgi:hypothetical protein